jgi:hypothetical protein
MEQMNPGLAPTPMGVQSRPPRAYSPGQICGATLLGSPVAGCILLASNYSLFGSPEKRTPTLAWGVVATIILCAFAPFLTRAIGSFLQVLPALIILQIANWLQGPRFKAFIESGGSKHSHWRVAGIGLLCLAAVCVVAFVVILLAPS